MEAPEWPAETRPWAFLKATSSAQTMIEALGFKRQAAVGSSVMAMTSGASTISKRLSFEAMLFEASPACRAAAGPTNMMVRPH